MIEASDVRFLLEGACPQLKAAFNAEDELGDERLLYIEMGAAARALGAKFLAGEKECLAALFRTIEHCLAQGTPETVALVVQGLLEDLQNESVTGIGPSAIEPYLGAQANRAWSALNELWAGDVDALRRWARSEGIEMA